jgi:putative spermidine/putrescine transport system substrate-binding protein
LGRAEALAYPDPHDQQICRPDAELRPTCKNMDVTPKMAARGITNTVDSTKGYWIPDYQKYLDHSDEIEETVNGIFAG